MKDIFLANEQATIDFADQLQSFLRPGQVVYLQGQLGAGKTTLIRALLKSLGYEGIVKSPTYTLVESYSVQGLNIHHFDLYRLADPEELYYIGLADYLTNDNICLFEWPLKGQGVIPAADLVIQIEIVDGGRRLTLQHKDYAK